MIPVLGIVAGIWALAALATAFPGRRFSASQRHFVWMLAQFCAVLTPAFFFVLPTRQAPVRHAPVVEIAMIAQEARAVSQNVSPKIEAPLHLPLFEIWLIGAGLLLAWTAIGILRVLWVSRGAAAMPGDTKSKIPILLAPRAIPIYVGCDSPPSATACGRKKLGCGPDAPGDRS